MKPIRYKKEMVDEFTQNGYWTNELFYDFYDRNAHECGDREALVDSKYRVTWAEAKRLVDCRFGLGRHNLAGFCVLESVLIEE